MPKKGLVWLSPDFERQIFHFYLHIKSIIFLHLFQITVMVQRSWNGNLSKVFYYVSKFKGKCIKLKKKSNLLQKGGGCQSPV